MGNCPPYNPINANTHEIQNGIVGVRGLRPTALLPEHLLQIMVNFESLLTIRRLLMKKIDHADKKKAASFLGKTAAHLGISMLFDFVGQLVFVAIVIGMVICLFNCR